MEDLLKIGAAYIRVSDERQDEYSPDSQLKKTREFAAKLGYTIPDEYVFYDDGISGRNVAKRDDFNRMIAMAKEKSHPFDTIFVWKFSRFARNQEQAILFKNLLKKCGVSVLSVSEPLPDGPFGSLIERIIEWMDEFYSINLGVEVMRGMTEKVSRGEPVCAPPFGYIMRDGKYFPDNENGNAEIVREIFQMYASGMGKRDIAVALGKKGVTTKWGKPPEHRWIDYILHNSCYIGKIRFSPDGTRSVSKREFNNENIMIVDGHHEPLISIELWDAVQRRLEYEALKYPKNTRTKEPPSYMLKGLVKCSACGATVYKSGKSGKNNTPCMQCVRFIKGACHESHFAIMPQMEAAVIDGIKKACANKTFCISPKKPQIGETAIDYDKLISAEEKRLERAKNAYLDGIDPLEVYKKTKEEIVSRIEAIKSKRDEEIKKDIDTDAFSEKVLGVVEFLEREDVSAAAKNDALRTIIEKIVYEKAKNNLAIYFHDI